MWHSRGEEGIENPNLRAVIGSKTVKFIQISRLFSLFTLVEFQFSTDRPRMTGT